MIVDQRIAHALKRILDYLADSEAKSYEEWPESERHNHVYHDALIVRDWLNERVDLMTRLRELAPADPYAVTKATAAWLAEQAAEKSHQTHVKKEKS
jgi:hypothetical protein